MNKNTNNIKIEKEINAIFDLSLELHDLIEIKEYSIDDILKKRHDLYRLGTSILDNNNLNIETEWYNFFEICLSYCYSEKVTLSNVLVISKYTNIRRNYDWIIYVQTNENIIQNEKGILLNDKEIFFNLCLLLSENITLPSNILHLLQLGYDYFNLDLVTLLSNKIIKHKIEKVDKVIIYLL